MKLAADALALCQRHRWPGNVREMENVLERCSAFCDDGTITAADLPREFQPPSAGENHSAAVPGGLAELTMEEIERAALVQTLDLCGGNKAETARRLGISEKSVYNKVKLYGIQ